MKKLILVLLSSITLAHANPLDSTIHTHCTGQVSQDLNAPLVPHCTTSTHAIDYTPVEYWQQGLEAAYIKSIMVDKIPGLVLLCQQQTQCDQAYEQISHYTNNGAMPVQVWSLAYE